MDRWKGIKASALERMTSRNYQTGSVLERLSGGGVVVGDLLAADRQSLASGWIPGVDLLPRRVFRQRHRGYFGEFMREGHGVVGELGFWPRQWATARMFAGTAKGFHIHPPHVPHDWAPDAWFQHLFGPDASGVCDRPYAREQWDAMFFIQGNVEMILVDERVGLERRVMRFFIEGDDSGGSTHAGVVIPAGVAHAIRVEGSTDAIMVYGTTTTFDPEAEGRLADEVEMAPLPTEWQSYIEGRLK